MPAENSDAVNEMPQGTDKSGMLADSQQVGDGDGQSRLFRLLRYSHVFASAVREFLELKYLREATRCPLTLLQFHLLKLVSLNGRHHVGELANFLGVSPPAATKNIDKLERLGLVVRTPSPGDRRATLLCSSARGRQLVQEYEDLKARRLAPVLDEFSRGEIDQFAHLLERFSLQVIKREDSGKAVCLRCAAYCEDHCPVGQVRGGCPYQKVRAGGSNRGAAEEVP